MSLTDFKQRCIESHMQSVERGEHDDRCEWRADGFYICNCSPRRRARNGHTEPPGELIHQMPICPRCDEEVDHDGDRFTCVRCCVDWDDSGKARFYDDHGDLSEELAQHEAAQAKRAAERSGADT